MNLTILLDELEELQEDYYLVPIPKTSINYTDDIRVLFENNNPLITALRDAIEMAKFYGDPYGEADLVDDNDYEKNEAYPNERDIEIPGKKARAWLEKYVVDTSEKPVDEIDKKEQVADEMNQQLVTCKNCGRVSMCVSKEFAEKEVESFNVYYAKLSEDEKSLFGRKASLSSYQCCKKMDLRPSEPGDCPEGVTICQVILENE